jgi:hypothetical protein
MQMICKLLVQSNFTLNGTTRSGQTDVITSVYLSVFYTCSTATRSETELAVLAKTPTTIYLLGYRKSFFVFVL